MFAGVIYLHSIADNRSGGIAGRNFDIFHKICGDTASKNVIIVTNTWRNIPHGVGEAREKELSGKFFKPALDKGAQMVRHDDTVQSAHQIIQRILGNDPVALRIQKELVDRQKDIVDTTAGNAINQELNEQIRRHQAELKEVQEEMMQALKEKDEETGRELEEEARRLHERMVEIAKDEKGFAASYAAEKERIEARIKAMEQGVQERERDVADVSVKGWAMSSQQDLAGILTTIPNHASPSRTSKTEGAGHRQRQFPKNSLRTPNSQMPSLGASYVPVVFRLTNHDG